jgi:DNA repair exonuclease SbcCD ATPase subunit
VTTDQTQTHNTGGRDPSHAIAAKQAQAAANRERIATAIAALQRAGQPVNVQAVARAAAVHPHTVRRNADLLAEIQLLRQASWQRPPAVHTDPTATAAHKALKAKLLASQAEVSDLRSQLTQLRRDAHQALGSAPTRPDPHMVEDLQREVAELRVQLANERDIARALREASRNHSEELTAAHEVARRYLRELNRTKDELQRARRELTSTRARSTSPDEQGARETPPSRPRAQAGKLAAIPKPGRK